MCGLSVRLAAAGSSKQLAACERTLEADSEVAKLPSWWRPVGVNAQAPARAVAVSMGPIGGRCPGLEKALWKCTAMEQVLVGSGKIGFGRWSQESRQGTSVAVPLRRAQSRKRLRVVPLSGHPSGGSAAVMAGVTALSVAPSGAEDAGNGYSTPRKLVVSRSRATARVGASQRL